MRFGSILLSALLVLFTSLAALASGKVALVIGNGAYQHATPLPNPPNDATDMAAMLEGLGFTVITGNDLTQADMVKKVGDFEEAARDADVTLFFYAGHGLQVNGLNYIVPIDAKLERASSLQFETIESNVILSSMSGNGRTAIALIDACRNNPLSRSFSRSLGATRSAAVGQGLAAPNMAAGGMIIGFATAPGDVAADGEGRNSPFTKALLKNMVTPGLEIQQMMTRVKADVYAETKEAQEPWHNTSLRSDVYLVEPSGKTDALVAAPQPQTAAVETEWNAVKGSSSIVVIEAFMAAHSDSPVYLALAQERKDVLQKETTIALLDSLAIPNKPVDTIELKQQTRAAITISLDSFLDAAKSANDGQTTFALLGPPTIELLKPAKNPGSKVALAPIINRANAPTLDVLLGENPELKFSEENSTNCRLDWNDRCPFLPKSLISTLTTAMAAKGMDINFHDGNYFQVSKLLGTDAYVVSNSPNFANGDVAIIIAIVNANADVLQIYGVDLSKSKLGVEGGEAASNIVITGAALEGDDIYLSFDSSYRCTTVPRKFGFIAKFSQVDRALKWVSPLNVSDVNFVVNGSEIVSANGGSCSDDFLYRLDKQTGKVIARVKLKTAVERLDIYDNELILQLYEGAGVYQLQ
jgi:Caspase domain